MKKLVYISLSAILIFSCKKKSEDPAPTTSSEINTGGNNPSNNIPGSTNPNTNNCTMPLSKVSYTNKIKSGKESYTYNSAGMVSKIEAYDSLNTIVFSISLTYNSDKTVSKYIMTYSGGSNTINYVYNGGLIANSTSSTVYDGRTTTVSNAYTYDVNQNLVLLITNWSSGSKDSTVFSGYVNGRPTKKTKYGMFSNPKQMVISSEEVYEYDANMNRTKETYTSYSNSSSDGGPISTSVYNTYVSNKSTYDLNLPLFPEGIITNVVNPNFNSKDQDKNTANSSENYYPCSTGSSTTYLSSSTSITNVSKNTSGCMLSATSLYASGGTCTKAAKTKTESIVINY